MINCIMDQAEIKTKSQNSVNNYVCHKVCCHCKAILTEKKKMLEKKYDAQSLYVLQYYTVGWSRCKRNSVHQDTGAGTSGGPLASRGDTEHHQT
jgi:hypothetical protein